MHTALLRVMGETQSGANITYLGGTRKVPLCVGHLVKRNSDARNADARMSYLFCRRVS